MLSLEAAQHAHDFLMAWVFDTSNPEAGTEPDRAAFARATEALKRVCPHVPGRGVCPVCAARTSPDGPMRNVTDTAGKPRVLATEALRRAAIPK